MWSIDSILAPTSLTPPPSPACLPGTTPTRRGYGSMRVRVCPYTMPHELERRTPWSRENCDPNTAPPTLLSPLNSTMPPQSVPVASMPRFASPLIGKELDPMCTPFVPKQTKNNNAWATGVFKTWISTRNSTLPGAETIVPKATSPTIACVPLVLLLCLMLAYQKL